MSTFEERRELYNPNHLPPEVLENLRSTGIDVSPPSDEELDLLDKLKTQSHEEREAAIEFFDKLADFPVLEPYIKKYASWDALPRLQVFLLSRAEDGSSPVDRLLAGSLTEDELDQFTADLFMGW